MLFVPHAEQFGDANGDGGQNRRTAVKLCGVCRGFAVRLRTERLSATRHRRLERGKWRWYWELSVMRYAPGTTQCRRLLIVRALYPP